MPKKPRTDDTPPDDTPQDTPTLDDQIAAAVQAALDARDAAADDAPPDMPQVPKVDHAPETPEEVTALAGMLAEFRREIHTLRAELRQRAGQQVQIAGPTETIEDRTNRRLEAIAQAKFYCPGCGLLYQYEKECTGPKGGHPHAPIEVVSTEELGGDPQDHTPAPATNPDGYAALAA